MLANEEYDPPNLLHMRSKLRQKREARKEKRKFCILVVAFPGGKLEGGTGLFWYWLAGGSTAARIVPTT